MPGVPWTDNPVDPEDPQGAGYERPAQPDLRVVTPTLPTGEYQTLVMDAVPPDPPRLVGPAPVQPPAQPAPLTAGPRHARPDQMPPYATAMFDTLSGSLELVHDALDRSEKAAVSVTQEQQQLRVAVGHLSKALDALAEAVVALHDRR